MTENQTAKLRSRAAILKGIKRKLRYLNIFFRRANIGCAETEGKNAGSRNSDISEGTNRKASHCSHTSSSQESVFIHNLSGKSKLRIFFIFVVLNRI